MNPKSSENSQAGEDEAELVEALELEDLEEFEDSGFDELDLADLPLEDLESGTHVGRNPLDAAANPLGAARDLLGAMPHDERVQRIAAAARQSHLRATPNWLRWLDDRGVGEGRFQSFRTQIYRVQAAPDVTYALDVQAIRELLLSGDLDRDTWIRPITDENEAEAAQASIHAGASDEHIRQLLAIDQMQREGSLSAASSTSNDDSKIDDRWRRIRTSLAKTEYPIQSLYRPVLAHVRKGEVFGFVAAVCIWTFVLVVMPLISGCVQAVKENGPAGILMFLLGMVAILVVVAISFAWTYFASKSQVVAILTFVFFGCSPFLVALGAVLLIAVLVLMIYVLSSVSGSIPGALLGWVAGLVRSPFLPRAPQSTDQKPVPPADLKSFSEPKFSSLPLGRLATGSLVIAAIAGLIAFGGQIDWPKAKTLDEIGADLESAVDEERSLAFKGFRRANLPKEFVILAAGEDGFVDVGDEHPEYADSPDYQSFSGDEPRTAFVMREVERRDDPFTYPEGGFSGRNLDLEVDVFRWPDAEHFGTLRITTPFEIDMQRIEGQEVPEGVDEDEYVYLDFVNDEEFAAQREVLLLRHLVGVLNTLRDDDAAPSVADTPFSEDEPPPVVAVIADDAESPATIGERPSADDAAPTTSESVESVREWVDVTGQYTIRAKLISIADGAVNLEKEDGSTVQVPLEKLSDEDRAYAERLVPDRSE